MSIKSRHFSLSHTLPYCFFFFSRFHTTSSSLLPIPLPSIVTLFDSQKDLSTLPTPDTTPTTPRVRAAEATSSIPRRLRLGACSFPWIFGERDPDVVDTLVPFRQDTLTAAGGCTHTRIGTSFTAGIDAGTGTCPSAFDPPSPVISSTATNFATATAATLFPLFSLPAAPLDLNPIRPAPRTSKQGSHLFSLSTCSFNVLFRPRGPCCCHHGRVSSSSFNPLLSVCILKSTFSALACS
ncbi:hypothetical protein EDB81DRAFT_268272 [Dactylonectria macrodidyma]|uniref:Uncharacterized protein n=1 Tax=Dactylonectria macrodidyma TaxID=307937 RepID=A0A9P9JJY6_9HYPO|nr:hypothetical protein EDB81DRAFT_268272 [Dactylonectria macrodidyma]